MSIYKACDIRGVYGRELTEAEMLRIGRALGALADGGAAVVGGDVRLSTPALKAALIEGLVASGAVVADLGVVPTPAFYFAADRLQPAAAAMVTASHNPPEFNGLKFMLAGEVTTPETVARLRETAERGRFREAAGSVRRVDVLAEYEDFVCEAAQGWMPPGRRGRVVVDAGNGCMSEIAPRVLSRLGFEAVPLFCEPDGAFPNRSPNPAAAANLTALCDAVRETNAALGAAFDGDGDRVVFVDERGRVVPSEFAACLLARPLLEKAPGGKVVYDLKSTRALAECVEAAGGVPLMERSGYAFIKSRMRRERAVFGAEVSGHFFYGELNGRDDGLLSAARMAAVVAAGDEPLGARVDRLPHYCITPDIRIPCEPAEVARLLDAIRAGATGQVCEIDGVRVDYDRGWGLARASVTEPLITLRFEAAAPDDLLAVAEKFLSPTPRLKEEVLTRMRE